jgi:hypothetical protein
LELSKVLDTYPPSRPIQKIIALFPKPIKSTKVVYPATFTKPSSAATNVAIEITKNAPVSKNPIVVITVIGRNVNP